MTNYSLGIMKDNRATYSTDHFSIDDWFKKMQNSEVVLPKFQRMEAWGPNQKKELLQSVLEGVPIGSLLLLEKGAKLNFAWKPIQGADGNKERIQLYLLDGQQRLTTLWRSFNEDYEDDVFFVKIEPDENTDSEDLPLIVRKRRYTRKDKDKKYPLWTFDPRKIHERGLVPFKLLSPDKRSPGKEWVKQVAKNREERHKLIDEGLDEVVNALQRSIANFRIPHIKLDAGTNPEMVLTTFTRVNEQGTKLSTFDLMVAKLAGSNVDLHDQVADLRTEVPLLERFLDIDDLDILRAAVLLQGKKPTQSRILDINANYLTDNWDDLVDGCDRALSFLQEEGIYDKRRLPSKTVLPFLFALWARYVPKGGTEEGKAREAIKKYLWRAFFSDHFEKGSTNTLITRDYRAMESYLCGEGKLEDVPCFDADLPSKKKIIEAGWPKNKDRLARAILALTLREGALDIYSGERILASNISNREYHHLFPQAYLGKNGHSEEADRALNVALITPKTNKEISATNPREYLLKVTACPQIRENKLKDRLKSHLVPYNSFQEESYPRFLEQRAELVKREMEKLI